MRKVIFLVLIVSLCLLLVVPASAENFPAPVTQLDSGTYVIGGDVLAAAGTPAAAIAAAAAMLRGPETFTSVGGHLIIAD
jgi:hypothetical protein